MHQAARTADPAFTSVSWAVGWSVCIHGLLLAAWLHARATQEGSASISRKRGGLTTTLTVRMTASTASPTASPHARPRVQAMPKPHPQASPVKPAQEVAALPTPAAQPEPSPETSQEPTPQAATAPPQVALAEPAGARFANLFAPIVSRPLGHGRWTTSAVHMPTEAQAAMQREQAIQGLRQAVQMRLAALRAELQAQPLSGMCEIRMVLESQSARIQCEQAPDHQRVAAMLSSVIQVLPEMAPSPNSTCLKITAQDLRWEGCPASAQP